MTDKTTQPREQAGIDLDKLIAKLEVIAQVVDGENLPNTANALRGIAADLTPQSTPEAQKAVAIVTGSSVQWLEGAGKLADRSPLYASPVAAPEAPTLDLPELRALLYSFKHHPAHSTDENDIVAWVSARVQRADKPVARVTKQLGLFDLESLIGDDKWPEGVTDLYASTGAAPEAPASEPVDAYTAPHDHPPLVKIAVRLAKQNREWSGRQIEEAARAEYATALAATPAATTASASDPRDLEGALKMVTQSRDILATALTSVQAERDELCALLGCATAPSRNADQARCESENAEFTEWWNREQACPEHSLITENAAHAAWQERARRAALTQQSAAQAPNKLATYPLEELGCEDAPDDHKLFRTNDWQLTAGDVRKARAAQASHAGADTEQGEKKNG